MMTRTKSLFFLILFISLTQVGIAQELPLSKLVWEVNKVNLGTVFEESGPQLATFRFTHTQDSVFVLERVWTDCGCTTAEYTQDSLNVGEEGIVSVSFNPSTTAGYFSKLVVVKGNLQDTQDTLYIEGVSIPAVSDPELVYTARKGDLGFRLSKVNMGDVFTNEPKIKDVEFFNFGPSVFFRDSLQVYGPEYIRVDLIQDSVPPMTRGLLQISYNGQEKGDLGFFEEGISLTFGDSIAQQMAVLANVFEFYPAFSKENLRVVPNLSIDKIEIDLKEISANTVQNQLVTLTNKGQKSLEIKKIQGNCDCLVLKVPQTELAPGESMTMEITFDPKGRKGIDQRNIYIFSNDPLNPVQTLVIKSRIK
ncbi:Protein of unknown function [Algoriphagus faecimaris]|uniref:DUF1573 domain-containing protein n=1 Tax=Algoriphagus faecimaris TaxID=686796 RepID=A0A1G6T107_9BACT|nr:DUF1573 domain-containing protein [Algoriphagus faecimaris]SDD22671.1 Protein of unknown function [Algoriphagus faecimaris]